VQSSKEGAGVLNKPAWPTMMNYLAQIDDIFATTPK